MFNLSLNQEKTLAILPLLQREKTAKISLVILKDSCVYTMGTE